MLRHIAAFEWRYQVKSPVFWVGCLIFFLLTFGSVTVDTIQIGGRGNVNLNSPYAILQTVGVMSIFMLFIVVSMVAGAVLRDDENISQSSRSEGRASPTPRLRASISFLMPSTTLSTAESAR